MNRIVAKIISFPGTVIHTLVIPVFAFVFTLYYQPCDLHELLTMDNVSFSFNATILFCIAFVTLSITRWGLCILGKSRSLTGVNYLLWCVGEIILMSLFSAMYVVLISTDTIPYFTTSGIVFLSLTTIFIYPYGVLWLCYDRQSRINIYSAPSDDTSLLRFYDEYKKLRLVIAQEAVMFIKSEDNYVQIHYLDRNMSKKFMLRSSMRALEEDLAKRGLVRCHRSYFINPSYIKIVHKDESGLIVAELNQEGFDSIPISRKYHDQITKLL